MSDRRGKPVPLMGNAVHNSRGSGDTNGRKQNRSDRSKNDGYVNGNARGPGKSQFTMAQIVSGAHLQQPSNKKSSRSSEPQGKKNTQPDSEALKLNADVCKRMDPEFLRIIRVSSQVAIFDYDCQGQKWNDNKVQGCLFFYERKSEPKYGLSVLNRKSLNNFMLLLKPDTAVQVDIPNILIRDGDSINCLWFHDEVECKELAADINRKLKSEQQPEPKPVISEVQAAPPQQQQGSAILNILCQKLMASSVDPNKQTEQVVPKAIPPPAPAPVQEVKPLESNGPSGALQALFGVPGTQQAQASRVSDDSSAKSDKGNGNGGGKKLDMLRDELRATLGILGKPDAPVWQWGEQAERPTFGGGDEIVLQGVPEQQHIAPFNFGEFLGLQNNGGNHNPGEPQMESVLSYSAVTKPANHHNGSLCGSASEMRTGVLNKEQMLKAFSYLLETDPDFTERLHEAYLRSLERNQ